MKNIIRQRVTYLFKQKNVRKYSVTHQGLLKIIALKPRTQLLLADMLALIGSSSSITALTIEVNYKDLGFRDFRNFSRYRNELIDERLLFFKDNVYFVNPCYINYFTRRQKDYFFKLFKLKSIKPVVMSIPKLRIVGE